MTETTTAPGVPRRIHQIWLGDRPPAWILRCMATVREHHPDWEYVLWNEESIAELDMPSYRDIYDQADRFALPGRVHQMRSDLARYEILRQHGGVYVDSDMEFVRPLDQLPAQDTATLVNLTRTFQHTWSMPLWFAWETQDEWVSNAVIGATGQRGTFLDGFIELLPGHIHALRGKDGLASASRLTGPRVLTRRLRAAHMPAHLYDQETFFPYDWSDVVMGSEAPTATNGITEGTIAIHHWANQRRINGRPLEADQIGAL